MYRKIIYSNDVNLLSDYSSEKRNFVMVITVSKCLIKHALFLQKTFI